MPTLTDAEVVLVKHMRLGMGDRFDALIRRLGSQVSGLSETDLRWARLFFNAGFVEGSVVGARNGVEALARIDGELVNWRGRNDELKK